MQNLRTGIEHYLLIFAHVFLYNYDLLTMLSTSHPSFYTTFWDSLYVCKLKNVEYHQNRLAMLAQYIERKFKYHSDQNQVAKIINPWFKHDATNVLGWNSNISIMMSTYHRFVPNTYSYFYRTHIHSKLFTFYWLTRHIRRVLLKNWLLSICSLENFFSAVSVCMEYVTKFFCLPCIRGTKLMHSK